MTPKQILTKHAITKKLFETVATQISNGIEKEEFDVFGIDGWLSINKSIAVGQYVLLAREADNEGHSVDIDITRETLVEFSNKLRALLNT